MPDGNDTPTPPPLPPAPLTDRELLERIEQWLARIARATGSQALALKDFARSSSEELGQLHGGILLIDGTTQRIARVVGADAQASGGMPDRSPRERKRTPTDQYDLPGGVTVEAPKRTVGRVLMAWKGIKALWWLVGAAIAGGGWILHLLHVLAERGHGH